MFSLRKKFELYKVAKIRNAITGSSEFAQEMYDNAMSEVYFKKGEEKYDQNDFKAAIENFSIAIILDSSNIEALRSRSISFFMQQKYWKAKSDLKKIILQNPNDADAFFKIGFIYGSRHRHRSAILYFTKALEIDPEHQESYHSRGVSQSSMRNYNEAITDFSRSLELCSEDFTTYLFRGLAKFGLKDYWNALSDINKVIEIEPNCEWAYFSAGKAFIELKKPDAAKQCFTKAAELGHPQAYKCLKRLK